MPSTSPEPAPPSWLRLLSDPALTQLSGPSVFARGKTYAASGAIEALADVALRKDEQAALQAVIQGTQAYEVRVWVDADSALDGACNCPHAQSGNFCKHLVSLCLAWRGRLGGAPVEPDAAAAGKVAAAAKRARTQASNRDALRAFVGQQSAEALAERLWSWAENDRHLMADLKAWKAESDAGFDTKAVRSAITDMLRHRGDYLDWRDMQAYLQRARRVLPLLEPWLQRDAAELRVLCEHALRTGYKVAEHADDSHGELGDLLVQIRALLEDALRASPPPATWVDAWFKLMEADPWGGWNESAILAAAGPSVRERYALRVREDWEAYQGKPRSRHGFDYGRYTLRRRYLSSIAAQDDPRALLEAMAASASEAGDFHELISLCEQQRWFREALQWAQAAYKRYPQDRRCEDDLLQCYERDGWDEEALAIWRRRLQDHASVENYQATLKAARRAGHDPETYRKALFASAEQHELDTLAMRRKQSRGTADEVLRDVSVRIAWLLQDGEAEAALALAQQAGCGCVPATLEALARQLPQRHHAAAAQLLQRVLGSMMSTAVSPYAGPLALVREILARLSQEAQGPWLETLRTTYKAKRKFIAGLP